MKILIIEDEPSLQEMIRRTLEKERYIVECASDYKSALLKISDYTYDCILLDIMLPGGNGLDLLAELRNKHKKDSVIILSAKDSLEDKVSGLELGADDYLPKPFHLAELIARIRSVIRRKQNDGEQAVHAGNIIIYPSDYTVTVAGRPVELNRKEYDILFYFANRMGRLIDKDSLAESVWGDHIDQVDNFDFIYSQIKNPDGSYIEIGILQYENNWQFFLLGSNYAFQTYFEYEGDPNNFGKIIIPSTATKFRWQYKNSDGKFHFYVDHVEIYAVPFVITGSPKLLAATTIASEDGIDSRTYFNNVQWINCRIADVNGYWYDFNEAEGVANIRYQ
jgi:DNA-binding response OmpR family regulator